MGAVIMVLPLQKTIDSVFPGMTFLAIFLWIILEEVFKFFAAYLSGISSVSDNEPIDPVVYMITAALGFAALENTLFILEPLLGKEVVSSVITGNLRFIGASLLHVVSSGIVGLALAFSFYETKKKQFTNTLIALAIAVSFHAGFNLAIVNWGNFGAVFSFGMVWLGVVFLLLMFEKVKTIAR